MIRRTTLLAAAAVVAVGVGAAAGADARPADAGATRSQATPTTLRLDGIGPLRLGMRRGAGVRTGWLADRSPGCKLGGPPYPIAYRLTGDDAPAGIRASAEFDRGRLRSIAVTRGVRTVTGVVPGRTTVRGMLNRYRAAGFTARAEFVDTFGGTFVSVRRGRRQVIGGFARGRASARRPLEVLGIPYVPTCE